MNIPTSILSDQTRFQPAAHSGTCSITRRKRVIIVDEQPEARLQLRRQLSSFEDIVVVDECSNGQQAISAINEKKPDCAFLSIQIPGYNGFEVIQRLSFLPKIIFSNTNDSFALSAFDYNALDYLLKPYNAQRLSIAVNKLRDTEGQPPNTGHTNIKREMQTAAINSFLVYLGKKMVAIDTESITYLEASDDYTKVHTAKNTYISHTRISNMDQKLPADTFIRIHRSTIVNIHQIENAYRDACGYHILMAGNITRKVARSYENVIKNLFL